MILWIYPACGRFSRPLKDSGWYRDVGSLLLVRVPAASGGAG